jgi:hypothetical protein
MVIDALYIALVICNLLLLAVCYRFGSRVKRLAAVAILFNGVALVAFLLPLATLLLSPAAPPESPQAIRILLPATAVLAVQLIALVTLHRRKVRDEGE